MNESQIRDAMKTSAARVLPGTVMPAETLRRARRGRRRMAVASLASVAVLATGAVATVRSITPPVRPPVATAASCALHEIATIDRGTTDIALSAASGEAAYFAGLSPEYKTHTVDARPRAGRVDSSGRIRWIEFDHPEEDFQVRNAWSAAAVGADEAWFIVDGGGRSVGESVLWHADGERVTRPLVVGKTVRDMYAAKVAARGGVVWAVGATSVGSAAVRRENDRWSTVKVTIPDLDNFDQITVDRGGNLYVMASVTDWDRMPKPATPGGAVPGILVLKAALWRLDGDRWTEIPIPDGIKISAIEGGRDGALWAVAYTPGTGGLTVMRHANEQWTTQGRLEDGNEAASVRISSDDDGRLFIADYIPPGPTERGTGGRSRLWVLAGGELTRQTLPESTGRTMITGIAATDDGALWLVAGDRVLRGACE